ncbi:MAG: helix-turn-helix transcriptional regulator [Tistlia sp.]|uniref:helix-turn-helix domain-containing protein n=1 Tax=Tistlia sp. TaxID=3057121 RepID=UPI0034A25E0A
MTDRNARPGNRPQETLNGRLRRARGGLARAKAATALGLTEEALQRVEAGIAEPTVRQLREAAELYGVSVHWLLFGEGVPDPVLAHLGADVAALLRQFMRDRFGASAAEQLTPEELREVNDQADRLQALVGRLGGSGAREVEG